MQSCVNFNGTGNDSYRPPLLPEKRSETTLRHRLFVDSRDCVANLSVFKFTVYLSDPFRETSIGASQFKRVKSVELKGLAFPKIADDYVIMDVQELNDDTLLGSNSASNQSFAVVYFDSDVVQAVGEIRPVKGYDYYQKAVAFNPVLPSLSKLSVTFKKRDGTTITTSDTGNVNHCSFMLEITSYQ
jgi:hypothetical protein